MEMSEMIATANARSIEEIKSFLSRQKETYKVPYETHPADGASILKKPPVDSLVGIGTACATPA